MTSDSPAGKRALDQIVFRAALARSYLIAKRRFSTFGARPVIRGRVRCRMGGTAIVRPFRHRGHDRRSPWVTTST